MVKWSFNAELRGGFAESRGEGDSEGELLFFFSAGTLRLTPRNSALSAPSQLHEFKLTFRPFRIFR